MNVTVRVANDDRPVDRDHTNVTGWDVTPDGTLWIQADAGQEAVYAPGQWRWVERFPVPAQDATPPHPSQGG